MKGFKLKFKDEIISGAVEKGISGLLLSNKEGHYRLDFGGMDYDCVSLTWYSSEMKEGDILTLYYEDISTVSQPEMIRNVENHEQEDKLTLELYYRLKTELTEDGIL